MVRNTFLKDRKSLKIGLNASLGLILLLCGFVFPVSSHPQSSATAQAHDLRNFRSCFDGNFASQKIYLSFIANHPKLGSQPEAIKQAEQRYQYWRSHFECQWFDYTVDGITVTGFAVTPLKFSEQKLPVVVFNHGGNADIGAIKSQYIYGKLFPLAARGYIVIGSQYRGNGNREQPHSNPLLDEFGGRDVNDVNALLDLLPSFEHADPTRVALWGISRGGMMAYLAARQEPRFSAVIAQSAPTDLLAARERGGFITDVFARWIPQYQQNPEQVLAERSVIQWSDELTQPLLIIHGTADKRIPIADVDRLVAQLRQRQHPLVEMRIEGGDHGLSRSDRQIVEQIDYWLGQTFSAQQRE